MEIIRDLALILLGALIAALGYFVRRRVEGKPAVESLERQKQALEIYKGLKEVGLSTDDLRNLELSLTGREASRKKHSEELRLDQPKSMAEDVDDGRITNLELIQRAYERVSYARQKMKDAYAGIDARVGDRESQGLMNSQRDWERYSEAQAESAASAYEGGSIQPLIYLSELESLILERTARLQSELDELIRLGN